MDLASSRFHRALMEKIRKEEADAIGAVVKGLPKTLDEYRERVGFLKALRLVETICDEVEKSFQEK